MNFTGIHNQLFYSLICSAIAWLIFCGNYSRSFTFKISVMNYDYEQSPLSKSILSGVATGIIAAIANLLYNFIYRNITNFSMSWIINVSSIIFGSFILCVLAGLLFYFIVPYLKKKRNIYTILFLIITVAVILLGLNIHRSDNPQLSEQFRGLYFGVVIILGICCTLLIPWFASHKNSFF